MKQELYQLIASIRDRYNCGILMVSHDLHLVMEATDRVLCLNRHISPLATIKYRRKGFDLQNGDTPRHHPTRENSLWAILVHHGPASSPSCGLSRLRNEELS